MTENEKILITTMRKQGKSYRQIETKTGIKLNSIKTFCKRNHLGEGFIPIPVCEQCGAELTFTKGKKKRRFCSDKCRMDWWNTHPECIKRKAVYDFICACCKQPFSAYGNKNRKYCSHKCYIENRYGGTK